MFIVMGVLANGVLIYWLFGLGTSQQVYLRNLIFSDIVLEQQSVDLNQAIEQGFKRDTDVSRYLDFIHPNALKVLKDKTYQSDRELSLAILGVIGQADGSVCGLQSLGKTVFETLRGKGCCSDYSKAWLFYANFLGMQAREVSLFNHTSVEYFDRATGRWHWLDPFNRIEIVNARGQVMSLLDVRNAPFDDYLQIQKLLTSVNSFDANEYIGYSRAQMGTVFWRLGVNFLEVEALDTHLQAWGLPKNVRQLVLLVAGVQPRWLMLTTQSDYFYYKLLKSLIMMFLWLLLAINVVWLIVAFLLGKKVFTKYRDQSSA